MSVEERWRELQRTYYRFFVVFLLLVLFMGAINAEDVHHISLFGIKISGEGPALGILLLLTSLLLFFITAVSLVSDTYEDVIKSYVEVRQPDEVSRLYLFQFGWSPASFFGDMGEHSYRLPAKMAIVLSAMLLAGGGIIAMVLVVILQLYLFVSTIISVQQSEQLPGLINVPIVVVATCAALFSISAFLVRIPLPYSDYSNLRRLTELEKTAPERAREIWMKIAQADVTKERRSVGILQLVVVMAAAILPQVSLSGEEFFSDYCMLVPLLILPIIVFSVVAPMLDAYEGWSFRWHSGKWGESVHAKEYVGWKRRILGFRLTVCILIGILLFVSFRYGS